VYNLTCICCFHILSCK